MRDILEFDIDVSFGYICFASDHSGHPSQPHISGTNHGGLSWSSVTVSPALILCHLQSTDTTNSLLSLTNA